MSPDSRIVLGVGASHTTLMNTRWDDVDHLPRAHAYRDALAQARDEIASRQVDLVVVVGSNHFRGLWLDLMPTFTVGVGELEGAGEHGTPAGSLPTDPAAGLALCQHLVDEGFDPAFSLRLSVDHGITHAIQHVIPEGLPVVPVVINAFAPPLPPLARCLALGEALARGIAALPGGHRVAILATGGLSHRLPFPDWRHAADDDERFLVESWLEGRGRWQDYEVRRRALVVSAPPDLNEGFDRELLADLDAGRLGSFPSRVPDDQLVAVAGNGANEIRAWLAMAAACGHGPGRTLAYSPMPEWLTGMAVALVEPSPPRHRPPGPATDDQEL